MTDYQPSLSQEIASRAAAALGAVPAAVDRMARLHLLDALAVGSLGSARGPVRGLAGLVARARPGRVRSSASTGRYPQWWPPW